jgi:hypothetical protein
MSNFPPPLVRISNVRMNNYLNGQNLETLIVRTINCSNY